MTSPSLLLHSLVIFRNLLSLPVFQKLTAVLEDDGSDPVRFVDRYAAFVAELYRHTDNLSEYVRRCVYEDDNFYVRLVAEGKPIREKIAETLAAELQTLEQLARLCPADIRRGYSGFLPEWQTAKIELTAGYADRMRNIHTTGYGIYTNNRMFIISGETVTPLRHPDPQTLADLHGYETERQKIIANTRALLAGRPAVNVLLYGDAGTGKSSTVKAIVNAYADCGLRLIEVKKSQLYFIPSLIEQLAANPLKFILFVDDLSFSESDGSFAALKAILEGSAAARTQNIVIYATSNRRHLMKECHADRLGDDVHLSDTLEETVSLSARFGLIVTFQKPGKDAYLAIVSALAETYGLKISREELFRGAELHALRSNGRTPRAAKQYVELLAGQIIV